MKTPAAALLLSLALAGGAPHAALPAVPPSPAAVPADPLAAPEEAPAVPRVEEVHAVLGPVPGDLRVRVQHLDEGEAGAWRVRVERRGYLVALRSGQARHAGASTATIDLADGEPVPLVWETTHVGTLATTRGMIRVDGAGAAGVTLAEAPVPAAIEAQRRHRCGAHHDGAGGFTVICALPSFAAALNLAGDLPDAGVTFVRREEDAVLRLDLPARPGHADAFAVGYSDHGVGVLLRAEASLLAGEDRASLALLSAERTQPVVQRRHHPRIEHRL